MRPIDTLGLAPVAPPSSMLSAARAFLDSLTPMPSAPSSLTCLTLAVATLLGAAIDAQEAVGQRRYILATGRRLPYLYVISLDAALDPANDRTSKAIVGRSKVATEALDGRLLGDPANLVVSEDSRTVYVVNHHGAIDNAGVSPARWPRTDRGARHRRSPGPTEQRHRKRTSAAHGLRRLRGARHRAPARDAGHRQRREPSDGGRRQSHHVRRPTDRQPPRHRRARAGLARVSVSRLPGALCPAVRAAAEPGRARPGSGLWMLPEPERVGAGPGHRWKRLCLLRKRRHQRRVRDRPRSCATRGQSCGDRSHPDAGRPVGHHRDPQPAAHHRGERRESARWIRGQLDLRDRRRPGERRRGRAPKLPASSSAPTIPRSRAIH